MRWRRNNKINESNWSIKLFETFKQQNILAMTQHEQSETNQSIFSTQECLELRKKVALTSPELIQLVSDEKKFNTKLEQLNKTACDLIDEDKCLQASVYLDQAQRILEYAAGCGRTIERTLITTILNNQACLLQRTSQFEQSANYLQAIIFNISEYIDGCQSFEFGPNHFKPQAMQFAEITTYFQRKLSLALYQLRFCALTSHAKNNELALKSAKKALAMLKEICSQEYNYQLEREKFNKIQQNDDYEKVFAKNKESESQRKLLKHLGNIIEINERQVEKVLSFKDKCLLSMQQYQKRIQDISDAGQNVFESYSIGNLMQASPLPITSKPSMSSYLENQFSLKGKCFKVVYLAMAHFTVATQLRLISASKYSLDDQQRKASPQFRQSKVYHLLALTLLSRYLPFKSVFFDHAVSTFKNHYGIDLLSQPYCQEISSDFSAINHHDSREESHHSISNIEEIHTYQQEKDNPSVEIHQQRLHTEPAALNFYIPNYQDQPHSKMMKQIHNQKMGDVIKIKHLKSKPKNLKIGPISMSRALDSERNMPIQSSKNKQNKSKPKLLLSKGKETLKSRKKTLQIQESSKALYYGNQGKSRSKSKRPLQRKNSKKGLTTKSGLIFDTKKSKNETKVDEQYGIKSAGLFGHKTNSTAIKLKTIKNSERIQQQNIYNQKSPRGHVGDSMKMKKPKNQVRNVKVQPVTKRKSMSKDRYW